MNGFKKGPRSYTRVLFVVNTHYNKCQSANHLLPIFITQLFAINDKQQSYIKSL